MNMNSSQRMHFRAGKVLCLPTPSPYCELCEKEEWNVRGRVYSLQIIASAPLLLLFGLLADDLNDICFTEHQVIEFVDAEAVWFDWGMRTHLFMGERGKVLSVRSGEDRVFHLEEHDLFCVGEVWPKGGRIYVPVYI